MERQTTADFLVTVTDPNGRVARPGLYRPPQTATEFAEYFKNSDLGRLNRQNIQDYMSEFVGKADLAKAYKESAQAEGAVMSRKGRYAHYSYFANIFSINRLLKPLLVEHS